MFFKKLTSTIATSTSFASTILAISCFTSFATTSAIISIIHNYYILSSLNRRRVLQKDAKKDKNLISLFFLPLKKHFFSKHDLSHILKPFILLSLQRASYLE